MYLPNFQLHSVLFHPHRRYQRRHHRYHYFYLHPVVDLLALPLHALFFLLLLLLWPLALFVVYVSPFLLFPLAPFGVLTLLPLHFRYLVLFHLHLLESFLSRRHCHHHVLLAAHHPAVRHLMYVILLVLNQRHHQLLHVPMLVKIYLYFPAQDLLQFFRHVRQFLHLKQCQRK